MAADMGLQSWGLPDLEVIHRRNERLNTEGPKTIFGLRTDSGRDAMRQRMSLRISLAESRQPASGR